MTFASMLPLLPLLATLAVAAYIDARKRLIPNWLTFGLLIAGFGRAIAIGSPGSVSQAVLGMLAGGFIPLILFALSALGGGDVKLMAAIGAWLGPVGVVTVLAVEAVLGLVIVLSQAAAQRRTGALFRNSAIIAANFAAVSETGFQNAVNTGKACQSVARPLPFAVPVLIATLIVLAMGRFSGR